MEDHIKAYFFDWGGTLAYTTGEGGILKFLTDDESSSLLVKKFDDVEMDENRRIEVHERLVNKTHTLYPDSEETISRLKRERYKLAIVSNMDGITAKRVRGLFPDFLNYFDVVTFSAEVGMMKPDTEIFRDTFIKLNSFGLYILLRSIMVVGDKEDKDIIPAKKLGMRARLIDRSKQTLMDVLK